MILSVLYYLGFSALFFLTYYWAFSKLSFHAINRGLILLLPPLAIAIALIAPRFTLELFQEELIVWQLPEIQIEGQALNLKAVEHSSLPSSFTWLYLSGLALSLIYFALGIARFLDILRSAQVKPSQGFHIHWSDKIETPFCFGSKIFLPQALQNKAELPIILEHELQHIAFGHTSDRLYFRALSTLLWFDPFIHAFARELRQVHEYQVDEYLLQYQPIEDYAQTLLSSTLGADLQFPEKALAPSPFFNSSLIKSRITMMYSSQSRPWRKSLYALILPLALGMVVFACNKNEIQDVKPSQLAKANPVEFSEIDELPVTGTCTTDSDAEARKACVFGEITNHIVANFKYPELAKKEGLEGNIYTSFVIETDGTVGEVEVVRSIETTNDDQEKARIEAEEQAVSLIASLPKFDRPAFKEGKAVRLQLIIPISLRLQ